MIMKTPFNPSRLLSLLLFMGISLNLFAQKEPEKLGLPGDNLNLYAVMDLFQKSPTLEEFENALNSEDQKVNNLDLNNDGDIDYIKVIDNVKGTTHNIVLRVDVRKKESQDVAVFVVDKNKDGNVSIQLIGDKDLYGKDYIVEPATENQGTPNPGYKGGNTTIVNNYNTTNNTYNNNTTNNTNNGYNGNYNNGNNFVPAISNWVIVSYLFSNAYTPWNSPWYWGYYPAYWRPWRPYYWYDYNYHWWHRHQWHYNWYCRPQHVHYHPGYYNNYYHYRMRS
ncbi:MAG: hypothetical protein FGM54_03755, partial [Chitinophagaceae bacterium]|nr:hypothetical protein [Chitinophagaceae bacterium]